MTSDVTNALGAITETGRRLVDAIEAITDEMVPGPSRLPGWTRGHVLAHLTGVGNAVARQLEKAAAAEEVVDFYDGGRPGRDAAIEAGAGASAAEHRTRIRAAVDRVDSAVAALSPDDLDRVTGFRGRPAGQVVLAWWRETEIHLTDLAAGPDHTAWGGRFRDHLTAYLEPRVPDGVQVELVTTDTEEGPRVLGAGSRVTVSGAANDLVAWIAGREPLGVLTAERDGAASTLPELDPWP